MLLHNSMIFQSRRLECFRQLIRVVKPGGRCLVTAWAFNQRKLVKNDGEDTADGWILFTSFII